MKKLIALVCALALTLSCTAAFAATLSLGSHTLTIPDSMSEDELTQEDIADDMVCFYYNDDVDFAVYSYPAEGYTLEEIVEETTNDDSYDQMGITTINDVETAYFVESEDSIYYVEYMIIENDTVHSIVFGFADTAANEQVLAIMETLE